MLVRDLCARHGRADSGALAHAAGVQAAGRMYPTADPKVSMQLVFFASTVNGIFEELFVVGYIITALLRRCAACGPRST